MIMGFRSRIRDLIDLPRRIRLSLARRGVVATLLRPFSKLAQLGAHARRTTAARRLAELEFDREHNIDTTDCVPKTELEVDQRRQPQMVECH